MAGAKRRREHRPCFYCGALVSGEGKGDHFPLPKCAGGDVVVDCCLSCHDMKDRYRLNDWPTEWVAAVIADMPKLSRESRLLLAKAIRLMADVLANKLGGKKDELHG